MSKRIDAGITNGVAIPIAGTCDQLTSTGNALVSERRQKDIN
jgi:hypothetical protein